MNKTATTIALKELEEVFGAAFGTASSYVEALRRFRLNVTIAVVELGLDLLILSARDKL